MSTKLWTLKDVANYLNMAYACAAQVTKWPTFPKAIRIPNGRGGMSHAKWDSNEVITWAHSYQEA